jgi:simple sugar transport system permease protein
MLRLEPRREPSTVMLCATPALALGLTIVAGLLLFLILGKDPARAMGLIFIEPFRSVRGLSEMLVKATPLIIIAVGLSIGFRAGVWNIGAEGQFVIGAISGGAVALALHPLNGIWLLPLMCLAGIAGGMAWAAIPAVLKTRYGANEILVSLMLVYVASLLLNQLMHGVLKDPDGFNFPESRLFQSSAKVPILIDGTRAHAGILLALAIAAGGWWLLWRRVTGFKLRVLGEAPAAARFAGFSEPRLIWFCLLLSGGLAGLAGVLEAAGPVGQLVPALPVGYGFTAIIVAFLGRLNPIAIVPAGLLIALTHIGGETAQIAMSLPSATTSVFQGLLLFFLLASDVLVGARLVWRRQRAST